jgi:hypothetical protein
VRCRKALRDGQELSEPRLAEVPVPATETWGRVVVSVALVERTMQVGDPEEEIEKVAQAGIRGMVGALGRETISPHVMIDAALHVLAALVASS